MFDGFREECGVFGIYGHPDAANLTYLGLYALQHRGQEAAGIVSSDGKELFSQKAMGLVADIFTEERIKKLPGNAAIGHNRYSTTGDSSAINIQPILVNFALGGLAIAHNGNLVNAGILKDELEAYGSIFQSTMDSEVIIHLIAQSRMASLHERIVDALGHVQGSYSLVLITEKEIIAVRDPHGFRPLALGEVDGAAVVASETCAFDLIEATYVRDVEPGEMIVINKDGIQARRAIPLHFRVHLFCSARQQGLRTECVRYPQSIRQAACEGVGRFGRRSHPRAGLGCSGGAGIRGGGGASF